MLRNIVSRTAILVAEYRKVLEQKYKVMQKAIECIAKLDNYRCPVDLSLPVDQMSEL